MAAAVGRVAPLTLAATLCSAADAAEEELRQLQASVAAAERELEALRQEEGGESGDSGGSEDAGSGGVDLDGSGGGDRRERSASCVLGVSSVQAMRGHRRMDAGADPRTAASLGMAAPLPPPGGPARLANGMRAVRELFWRACTKGRWRDLRWLDDVQGLATRRTELDHRLALLERTSLFNDGFFIWHAGPFATVNGLRLGRLKTAAVDWEEVNAALGQLAMLVSAVASRISDEFVFQRCVAPLSTANAPIGPLLTRQPRGLCVPGTA